MSAAAETASEASASPRRGRILIVANPAAGGYRAERIEAVAAALRAGGARADVRLTTGPGDLGRIAATLGDWVDVLAVAGGDGSINEAVVGLQSLPAGRRPDLAVIPAGTANVLAYELALPKRPAAIAAAILGGKTVPLHTGTANGRAFFLMVSVGFDAEVVHHVRPAEKKRWKQLAFVATALRRGFGRRQPDLEVETDRGDLTCRLAVVSKAVHYGGPFRIAPEAGVTRPGLVLVALTRDDPAALFLAGMALLAGRLHRSRAVRVMAVERVRITSTGAVPAQLDGEAFGTTPLDIIAGPAPLRIVVP